MTKMFQKIQDLIDDKDALVFVLIDEVGVYGHWPRACGGSRLNRPLRRVTRPCPWHPTRWADTGGRRTPLPCAQSLRWRAPSRGARPCTVRSALHPHRWRASQPPAMPAGRAPSLQMPSAWSTPSSPRSTRSKGNSHTVSSGGVFCKGRHHTTSSCQRHPGGAARRPAGLPASRHGRS